MNQSQIQIGKPKYPPSPQSWAFAMGHCYAQWLNRSGQILNEAPRIGVDYRVRFNTNFSATENSVINLCWLPADSSINGIDNTNLTELNELRFLSGAVRADSSERTVVFTPAFSQTPFDLLALETQPVERIDALTGIGRRECEFGRFKCVEYSAESDVTSQFLFVDNRLVMLQDCVWNDCYFWIGNGRLSDVATLKLFPDSAV